MDEYTLIKFGSIIFATLGTWVIVWLYVRGRTREGIRPFQLAEKDKAQLKDIRSELNIWRLLARLLGGIGALSLVAGMMSLITLNSSGKFDWRSGVALIAIGIILILPTVFLARRSKLQK